IVVIIANNRRIVTGLAKGFYPNRVGRTVKNVESSLTRYARTPDSYIVLIIAIVVGGNKEVTGESPIKSDRRTASVEVVVPASLIIRAAAEVTNNCPIGESVAVKVNGCVGRSSASTARRQC